MQKAAWFLLGGLVTALFIDWAQLRFFHESWEDTAARCVEFSSKQVAAVSTCETSLRACILLGDDADRARLINITKLQTVMLIREATRGDKIAQKRLADLGWTKELEEIEKRVEE